MRFFLLILVAAVMTNVHGRHVTVIKWFHKNPLFITGGNKLVVKPGSWLNFECPNEQEQDFENVWMVGSEGYRLCDATGGRLVRRCTTPEQQDELEEFHSKNPMQVGSVHYFISTSTGDYSSLYNTRGGHCQTQNLKLTIYVQP